MRTLAVSTESIVLALICLADTFTTLIFISMGAAVEQNPMMACALRHGSFMFIMAKLASFVPFILVTESYRRRNPVFARNATRTAIGLYILTYVVLTLHTNFVRIS